MKIGLALVRLPVWQRRESSSFGVSCYSQAIGLRRLDLKVRQTGHHEQVLIAADEQTGSASLSEIEKGLVFFVPAKMRACLDLLDYLAIRQVVGQQFMPIVLRQPKL